MKLINWLLVGLLIAMSWLVNDTARQRDEAYALAQEALDLLPRWERAARIAMDRSEYWYSVHMRTVQAYEHPSQPNEGTK